ncbi:12-oxophytodienoate reductase [Mycobacterium sp. 21AC1]|uniref:oxidoreductase n=1 Tax=[Mycobacterium] appelbergii TaxID=2939269 RepID=UPI0029391AFB|nr:12-oxophytodienoate reductase [Mycobacterium sp. 21AC1]MDV3130252.1 12-oxophytodienoate reductase [Mycobacterium sp. 21AC1]
MDDPRLQALFTPVTIGGLTLPNRFAMAPMTRFASPAGVPGPDVAPYYARRAAGGTALIITEGVRIPHQAAGPDSVPKIDGDDVLRSWRAVTDAVHAAGGAIAAQLWHEGSQHNVVDGVRDGQEPVSPSGIDVAGNAAGRALRIDELGALVDVYALAASNARDAGFDAVEVHGGHGYLLDQFLWDKTNLRDDRYGGTVAARTRFPAEVVAAVRAAVGPGFPIIFRFSQWKINRYDAQLAATPVELEKLLIPLIKAGVDAFHPSTRRHYLPAFPDHDPRLSMAGWVKKLTGLPAIAVGSVGLDTEFKFRLGEGERIPPAPVCRLLDEFEAGEFDIVAIGRALLADPGWVARLRDGALDGFAGFDADSALARLY